MVNNSRNRESKLFFARKNSIEVRMEETIVQLDLLTYFGYPQKDFSLLVARGGEDDGRSGCPRGGERSGRRGREVGSGSGRGRVAGVI